MNSEQSDDPDDPHKRFFMAPDHRGHWIVQNQSRSQSGTFIDRKWARKFALSENGHRPDLIVELPQASVLLFRQAAFPGADVPGAMTPTPRKAA